MDDRHTRAAVVAAFAAVYLIWGSTYLGIRIAIETLPPFLMAGARFVIAGALLYGWCRLRNGAPPPGRPDWRNAATIGGLLLMGGNGSVVWAQQFIPSGLAALLVATVPLFMVVLEWLWNGAERPGIQTFGGLLLGFCGVLLLVGAPGTAGGTIGVLAGVVILFAALSWATGSIYSRRVEPPPTPRLGTAMQMLAGGGLLTVVGLVSGEAAGLDLAAVSLRSWLALAYLVVFGSLVAFSAYVWLLRVSTPDRVSTYAYVNPAVALFLGWSLAGEPLTARTLLGSAVILVSVVIVTTRRRGGPAVPDMRARPVARGAAVTPLVANDGADPGRSRGIHGRTPGDPSKAASSARPSATG